MVVILIVVCCPDFKLRRWWLVQVALQDIHWNTLSFEMAPQQKSGIAVGINKGHITTRRELKQKPSQRRVCNGWIHLLDG